MNCGDLHLSGEHLQVNVSQSDELERHGAVELVGISSDTVLEVTGTCVPVTPVSLASSDLSEAGVSTPAFRGVWSNELTFKLLEKVRLRRDLFADPKFRRRSMYEQVAAEFQEEGTGLQAQEVERKFTSLYNTYKRNVEKRTSSNWQYFSIFEEIFCGGEAGSSQGGQKRGASPPKLEIRQSKRMRTKPAKLLNDEVEDEERDPSSDLHARLDQLSSLRRAAVAASDEGWGQLSHTLAGMGEAIASLNGQVRALTQLLAKVVQKLDEQNMVK